jgi:hypothetical protein
MPDSLDEILYMGGLPPNEDFIIIIRLKNFKGDSVKLFNRDIDFNKNTSNPRRHVTIVDDLVFGAKGKVFLYENKPAVRVHKDEFIIYEDIGEPSIHKDKLAINEPVDGGHININAILNDPNRVFTAVEKEPEFPGGIDSLNLYLKKNLKWPDANHVARRVIVSFVVERDGTLTNVKPTRVVDPAYATEAVRVIRAGPKWSPGYDKGKPVRVQYTIPINFSITNNNY